MRRGSIHLHPRQPARAGVSAIFRQGAIRWPRNVERAISIEAKADREIKPFCNDLKRVGTTLAHNAASVREEDGERFGVVRRELGSVWHTIRSEIQVSHARQPGPVIADLAADFRLRAEDPRDAAALLSELEVRGCSTIADGVDEVLRATREQLLLGASQIKIAAGGGISSDYDPIDVMEYSEDEMRAAVGAAEDWGTYVAAHAYTPRAIQRAIRAGVQCIDHGHLLDAATAEIMADTGTWLSMQIFLDDEDATPYRRDRSRARSSARSPSGQTRPTNWRSRMTWGADILFDPPCPWKRAGKACKSPS